MLHTTFLTAKGLFTTSSINSHLWLALTTLAYESLWPSNLTRKKNFTSSFNFICCTFIAQNYATFKLFLRFFFLHLVKTTLILCAEGLSALECLFMHTSVYWPWHPWARGAESFGLYTNRVALSSIFLWDLIFTIENKIFFIYMYIRVRIIDSRRWFWTRLFKMKWNDFLFLVMTTHT